MVAVTGANGLLGSFIVRELIANQIPFVALKRQGSDTSLLRDVAAKTKWVDADLGDIVSLTESLDGVTQVIHAAAVVSFNPRDAKRIFDTNVIGTRNLLQAAQHRNIERFVHISSVAALGRVKGQSEIDEDNKWLNNSLNTRYAESKYLAELDVFRANEEGLNTVVINPSIILAPADWRKSSAKLFHYVWKEKKFYIESDINFVDVRDVAGVARLMLSNNIRGERFIVNAGSIPFVEFFNAIATRFQKKPPSIKLTKGMLNIIATLEDFRSVIFGAEPLITKETARVAGAKFFYRNSKIRKALNFDFQSIDETLDWCCKYYMHQADR